ncbi:MAG: hypothetical protein L6R41_006532 [Letrouitia leprolyta]|nr:MAG: hypothetical protein L6R41_006532 [Letrouitia leprolyta]
MDTNQLKTRHLILGLLQFLNQMEKTIEGGGASSSSAAYKKNETELTAARRIPDPLDPDLVIIYTITPSTVLTYQQLFSTILYAIATAAQGPSEEFCKDLAGFSERRDTVFQIQGWKVES